MDAADYFLPKAADYADLTAWSAIIPARARILRTNFFGDVFAVDEAGAVHAGACGFLGTTGRSI
jgi:hypothetical protein